MCMEVYISVLLPQETAQIKNTPEINDADAISDEDFKTFLNLAR